MHFVSRGWVVGVGKNGFTGSRKVVGELG